MRCFWVALAAVIAIGHAETAEAAGCNLARSVENAIAQLADNNPVVTFISPIGETPDNILDDAVMATIAADGYFLLIQRTASGDCAGVDGVANPLQDPVKWQTARKNMRAAVGLD